MPSELIFVDYGVADNCCNNESFGVVCLKCGKCGRKFVNGFLAEEGATDAE